MAYRSRLAALPACRMPSLAIRLAIRLAVPLAGLVPVIAAADIYSEQQGEITLEASWYPRDAAYTEQESGFAHFEARPELYLETDSTSFLLQPRLSGGSAGHGFADLREAQSQPALTRWMF